MVTSNDLRNELKSKKYSAQRVSTKAFCRQVVEPIYKPRLVLSKISVVTPGAPVGFESKSVAATAASLAASNVFNFCP